MPTLAWALIAWLAVNALVQVWCIGRPRKPKTSGEAIAAIIELALAAWAVIALAS